MVKFLKRLVRRYQTRKMTGVLTVKGHITEAEYQRIKQEWLDRFPHTTVIKLDMNIPTLLTYGDINNSNKTDL